MRPFVLVLCLLAVIRSFAAEDPIRRLDGSKISPAEIDATVTRLMKAASVPGLGLAVINDGKVIYAKGYGLRDVEKKLPYETDTIVYAASFTKVAFAHTVLQEVEKGVLDLDRPLYLYLAKPLPQYEGYEGLAGDERYKKFTARVMLSHTSGLGNWRFFEDDQKVHIHFEPGTRYAYSGEGFQILQLVLEELTKKPLDELMRADVFEPFGMSHSAMKWQPGFEDICAHGYDEKGKDLGPERKKHVMAAGSMLTTVDDYARFLAAISRGDRLSAKMRAEMLKAQIQIPYRHQFPTMEQEVTDANKSIRLSYGLGVGLYWPPYGQAFFKEGHDDGWGNYFVVFDGKKTGMMIMTNSSYGEGIFQELLETILKDTFTPVEWESYIPYNAKQSQ